MKITSLTIAVALAAPSFACGGGDRSSRAPESSTTPTSGSMHNDPTMNQPAANPAMTPATPSDVTNATGQPGMSPSSTNNTNAGSSSSSATQNSGTSTGSSTSGSSTSGSSPSGSSTSGSSTSGSSTTKKGPGNSSTMTPAPKPTTP